MNADLYAHALYDSLKDSPDTEKYIANLVGILKERGHYKLLPEILSVYKRIDEQGQSKRSTLYVAKESDGNVFKDTIKQFKEEFNITEEVDVVVDETLVGGYTLRTSDKILDNSYKRSLLDLYRLITA